MSKNGKKIKASRRMKKMLQKNADDKDTDLKNALDETRKARAKPAAIGSRIILREDANAMTPTPGFSDLIRKKQQNSPALAHLPTDDQGARKYAITHLKAEPNPPPFWFNQQ